MEHLFQYEITPAAHAEIKRLVGQCIPQIKSSHRAEAIARGIGFGTNAALLAALDGTATLIVQPDRLVFEGFLADRDVDPEELQVDLLYDAVALATGGLKNSWYRPEEEYRYALNDQSCWRCREKFFSIDHKKNRICLGCKIREDRMPRCDFAGEFKGGILAEVYLTGRVPRAAKDFCARPGWTDVLFRGPFADTISMHMGYHDDARAGRWEDVPKRLWKLQESGETMRRNLFGFFELDW